MVILDLNNLGGSLQGISGRYELALTDRNMEVKSCLNIVLES